MTTKTRQCTRCFKIKPPQDYFGKSSYCKDCRKKKPKTSQEKYYLKKTVEEDKAQKRAQSLASKVEVTYICICSKNRDACKAQVHSSN